MAEKENVRQIDFAKIYKACIAHKFDYAKILVVTFILSCIIIFSIPRYFTSEVSLAPEMENSLSSGAISSIASSFGFDLNDMQTSDAITPMLYPDLMADNAFVVKMFNIKVKTRDEKIQTTYLDYLRNYQKKPWWIHIIEWFQGFFPKKVSTKTTGYENDPYYLSRGDHEIALKIREDVSISLDKKTGVIFIKTTAQDALVSKIVADSVRSRLQDFITEYRTSKARIDYEYYKKLASDAKHEYEKKRQIYGSLADANTNIALKSVEMKMEDMENDLQLKFNAYSTINTQLQASKAKVQERTPAFTVIKGAAVPLRPAGPKRLIFVATMLILAFMATTIYYSIKEHCL